MNFSSKQSKIVSTREVPSNDFKRALSTAVRITSSPLSKNNPSTKPKSDDAANAEKALETIEKELKLRTFLTAGKQSVAAIRERLDQQFLDDDDSSLSSPSNSQERRNAYNFELSGLSSSSDDFHANSTLGREKYLERDELKAIDRNDYSKKSSSSAVRNRRRTRSVSPPSRSKRHKSVGKGPKSPAKIKSRVHKAKRSKKSSKDRSHRKREKEKAKDRKRLRKLEEKLRSQSAKVEEFEWLKDGKHRERTGRVIQSTQNKLESLYAIRSDDSDDDGRYVRREGRRVKYRTRASYVDEKSSRHRETEQKRRKDWIKDGVDCEWSEMSAYRKSGTASAQSHIRSEKFDAMSYGPSTLRTGILSRSWREQHASYNYTNPKHTDQYYYPSYENGKHGGEYYRWHEPIDPPSKTSTVNDDLEVERGNIYRRYIDPNGNHSKGS